MFRENTREPPGSSTRRTPSQARARLSGFVEPRANSHARGETSDIAGAQRGKSLPALCHAVAQAVSTVHTKKHALGLPIYELTAIVLASIESSTEFEKPVGDKINYYEQRLRYRQENAELEPRKWANFLQTA